MSAARDEQLLAILESMAAKLRRGDDPGFEKAVAEHPEMAADLRELWGALVVAEEVRRGRSGADLVNSEIVDSGIVDSGAPTGSAAAGEEAAASRGPPRPPSIQGYEILSELGRGGMGVVYEARQLALGRIVALKMLQRGDDPSAESLARFRTEAESAARLDHPHIVPVYEVGASEGSPFFTMRCVAGESLARRLATRGPMGAREAAALLLPVARAVEYAHGRGVLHRDLKPSNILLDEAGVPLVADFGLARRIEAPEEITRSGAILGTPGYMAPEQASGARRNLGPAVDVYGLGAVLYHMLTGRPPFQAASPIDTVLSVLEEDPLPPRVLNPRVDPEIEMIVLKSLQKPAELRYATAGGFADDLQAFLAGEPVAARSAGLRMVVARLLRETHHASVLENWGLLWMWHSLAILILCGLTYWLQMAGVASPWPYFLIWTVGATAWGLTFWALRHRGGPVTFVERQIAHVWGGSIAGTCALFLVEIAMGLPVLTLSPVLAILAGMIFIVKAAVLAGFFYVPAAANLLAALPMALYPRAAIPIFGLVTAASFFLPGLRYHRRRRRGDGR